MKPAPIVTHDPSTQDGHYTSRHSLWTTIGHQLRCPSGRAGRLIGHLMGAINAEPNRIVIEALDIRSGDEVLELGFGPGRAVKALSKINSPGQVHGIDRSEVMLAQATRRNRSAIRQGRMHLRLGSFDQLDFTTASIDKLLAVNVAYFFDPEGNAIREANRVLKRGGQMAIYVTDKATMSNWPIADRDSHTLYDEEDIIALLMRGGFAAEKIKIRQLKLPFNITGLVAIASKEALPTPVRQYARSAVDSI